ncbi:caspase domain-containing protein [Colletotrichum chrysophilum]|uniref:Caspase domain-containing protein n=1 Tax=Colletotrichum chrysophilum TaxID=1836956 RepID=A0AAD8ZZN6_9PEZI|nr:caspase domain-containing protein [Colletotrichum chrysophilum]
MENTFAESQDPCVATVTCAGALQSTLEVINPTTIGTQTWWTAVALTRNYLNQYPVQVPRDTPFRGELVAALRERSLCAVEEDESPFAFAVRSKGNHYEISDKSSNETVDVPAMAHVRATADQVCDVIQHLAKFTMVKDFANDTPRNSFQKSFNISLVGPSGGTFYSGSSMQVDHRDLVTLIAENTGDRELYIYIFDLGPEWQVENIFQANHDVVPQPQKDQTSRGTARKTWKLRMEVPTEMTDKGQLHCNDAIVVFVTAQLASFDLLELPKLNKPATRIATDGTRRGGDRLLSEEWACFYFSIITHVR